MKSFRRIVLLVLSLVAVFGLVACGKSKETKLETVGISMPSKSLERWEKDGKNMEVQLKKLGYKTDIQYAQDGVQTQVSQIENMITKGVKVLVIASIDGEALTDVCDKAKKQGIPVVAYDRLIMNTKSVDYYATFDNLKVGELQAQYIVDKLELTGNPNEKFNIELFGGAPDDNNAQFFYEGAMNILNPYIKSGQLIVKSGQTEFSKIATKNWDGAEAQKRMDNLLSANYTNDKVDAVLTPNDAVAIGVVSSLKGVGYGSGEKMPIITGQDAETASVKSIIAGDQTMTVFKDTKKLAGVAIDIVNALIKEKDVKVNDKKSYDNTKKIVPTYLLTPEIVDKGNYKEVLVDSGYLKSSELD